MKASGLSPLKQDRRPGGASRIAAIVLSIAVSMTVQLARAQAPTTPVLVSTTVSA